MGMALGAAAAVAAACCHRLAAVPPPLPLPSAGELAARCALNAWSGLGLGLGLGSGLGFGSGFGRRVERLVALKHTTYLLPPTS